MCAARKEDGSSTASLWRASFLWDSSGEIPLQGLQRDGGGEEGDAGEKLRNVETLQLKKETDMMWKQQQQRGCDCDQTDNTGQKNAADDL